MGDLHLLQLKMTDLDDVVVDGKVDLTLTVAESCGAKIMLTFSGEAEDGKGCWESGVDLTVAQARRLLSVLKAALEVVELTH